MGSIAVIVLDTHIWFHWVQGSPPLPQSYVEVMQAANPQEFGVSAISCWEIAKLVEYGRVTISCSLKDWLEQALAYPGVRLLPLTPAIAAESTQLPGSFHSDPADQMIVATARVHDCPLLTFDRAILAYPHVQTVP